MKKLELEDFLEQFHNHHMFKEEEKEHLPEWYEGKKTEKTPMATKPGQSNLKDLI